MKPIRQSVWVLLACLLGLGQFLLSSVSPVRADSPNQLTITQVGWQPDTVTSGVSYRLWTITDAKGVKELNQMSDASLIQHYQSVITSATDASGQTVIALPNGIYYGRAYKNGQAETTILPFYLTLPDASLGNQMRINPKRKVETGRLKLIKYTMEGDIKTRLSGVTFVLYDEQNQPVRFKNGQFTTDQDGLTSLVTNEQGEIEVDGLLPGNYVFREAKALPGYRLIMTDHPVVVVANKTQVVEVENEKETPPSPQLPKLGVLVSSGLAVIGAVFLLVWLMLVKKKGND